MLVALAASAALGALISAAPAGAATVSLGRIAPMGVTAGCSGCSFLQVSSDPASFSYVVPPGGPWTVVSWSARGGSMPDTARLLIFRPTPAPGQFQLVAHSADVPIGVVEAPVTPVSIPVQPGDRIGLRTGGGDMPTLHPSAFPGDVFAGVMGNLMLGQTGGPGGTYPLLMEDAALANVSATLTAPDPVTTKKKCKKKRKKKGKALASSAKKKKKKCKKRKRKKKS